MVGDISVDFLIFFYTVIFFFLNSELIPMPLVQLVYLMVLLLSRALVQGEGAR